jgi:Haem-NO-binding
VHGFIFSEIRKYVESKLGHEAWLAVLDQAGLGRKEYENFLLYPDEEAVNIVVTASKITGLAVPTVLEDFGRFIGADLLKIYRPLLDPSWKTLEFLLNIEDTIHQIVRTRNKNAKPPRLVCTRVSDDTVAVLYSSPRKMSALGRGIVAGVAGYYGETVEISELQLAPDGSKVELRVRRVG